MSLIPNEKEAFDAIPVEKETLEAWLERNRIKSTSLAEALAKLGATETLDLVDLSTEDMSSFKPPFMKKLEHVRFERGVQDLKKAKRAAESGKKGSLDDASSCTSSSLPRMVSAVSQTQKWKCPPHPSKCLQKGCDGILSLRLGNRKNKYLTKLDGPDFRWIVDCSKCRTKWHACHYLCGHLQKISVLGSSDIIRHEQGRFNRWQKKVKPPCSMNPHCGALRAYYADQKKNSTSRNSVKSDSTSTTQPHRSPEDPLFDNEFKSMIGNLDLNASDGSDEFTSSGGPRMSNIGNANLIEPSSMGKKREPTLSYNEFETEMLDLCHEIKGKCLLKEIKKYYRKKMKK